MILRWLRIGLLFLIVLTSLTSSIQNLISTGDLGSTSVDPVADWEKRFVPLKNHLPFGRGLVGYISDASVPGVSYDAADDEGEYVLTQYVMSPIIIVKGTDQEWNIGNLTPPAYKAWSEVHGGEFEVTVFNGNIYLLHRAGK
jgi:hypothetical protein